MDIKIRKITKEDKPCVIDMMRGFYASDCVATNGSEEIFSADVDTCISDSPYLEGYVFEENNTLQGYAMLALSFSTEYGKPCVWIEDLFVEGDSRGQGIGSLFFEFIENEYPNAIFRLEVEAENTRALNVYKKCGFDFMPYLEMKK